jgi:hypothetical protein
MTSRPLVFHQDGVEYRYEDRPPNLTGKDVQRFTYGQEPEVIAELDLADGSTVEIHGYAEHWTKDDVAVAWKDDDVQHFHAWIPAEKVRRPSPGEWHGNFVSR